jgi:hypothetical protein
VGDNSEPYPDKMELWDTVTNTMTKGLYMSLPNNSNHQTYLYFLIVKSIVSMMCKIFLIIFTGTFAFLKPSYFVH